MGQEQLCSWSGASLLGLTEKKTEQEVVFPQVVFISKRILGVSALHSHTRELIEFKMHPVLCNRG